jgi:putative heme-binding domain-containing protein
MLLTRFFPILCTAIFVTAVAAAAPAPLFDGQSLAGWEGDLKWWRVQDSALTGGSTTEKVPRNFFLATTRSFQNFDLRLKLKLTGDPTTGLINSGVQLRSLRVPNNTEMSGYQVDAGDKWWGKLYDESRRNKVIADSPDSAAVTASIRAGDWNDYRILAEGPRLRSWINGVAALDYTETDPAIALDGKIGIQIHSGGIALVQVKDVTIDELPPTPGAPTWDQVGHPKPRDPNAKKKKAAAVSPAINAQPTAPAIVTTAGTAPSRDISYNAVTTGPRTPEEERLSFTLPPGFVAELVVAESAGFGKFIGLSWDARMRMWSMTALEYPVDGNEQKAASDALFTAGGRDKVVVFDNPYAAPAPGRAAVTTPPRVFADGLVMPLGVQPYKDGAFVQYGADIRFYRDTNADGRADRHDVILTGFGTQDSHLFPHQFLRQPGGQVFVAQGRFNYSTVRRPGGAPFADGSTEVVFDQCKLAAFALDGSSFENLTAGPNNIWGLLTSREGETFLQEANDFGYSLVPYAFGIHMRTGSRKLLRPYQPLMPPPLGSQLMGATGLSGLALAEDRDGLFRAFGAPAGDTGAKVFFLANPLTNKINAARATPDGARYRYERLPDFLSTDDKWFRPVALHFGPDGALYIVDWYNKIISHNEVPRTHPDRDKSRGRIWRIRHRDQPRVTPPDLTKLDDRALVAQLGAPNALVSRLAWLELTDRRATAVTPDLEKLAADRTAPPDRRLAALWALESLSPIPTPLLLSLAADPAPTIRHEAARLAAAHPRPESEFLSIATPLLADPSPSVRAALGDALRRVPRASARVMSLAAQLGATSLPAVVAPANPWPRYEREFERYLARWAMELNPTATAALLASPEGRALPLENRILATLALGGKDAAIGLARLTPELTRPLGDEEVRALAAHFAEPAVRDALSQSLATAATRAPVLRALLTLRTSLDTTPLNTALTAAARALLTSSDAADTTLGAQVAGAFKLTATEPALTALLTRDLSSLSTPSSQLSAPSPALAALRALRENALGPVATFERLARSSADASVRDEALAALAASRDPQAPALLVALLPSLTVSQRGTALDRLASTTAGANAILAGLRAKTVSKTDLGVNTADKLRTLLPSDPAVAALWKDLGGDAQRALRLDGAHADYSATQLTLTGPFTIECWAKLDPTINNLDALLSDPGKVSINFHAAQLRVWISGHTPADIVVAKKKTTARVWTHYAITRDAKGVFSLFINGELDATSITANTDTLTALDLGRANPKNGGTAGWLAEFRVWSTARSAKEIRENFDRSLTLSEVGGHVPVPALNLTHVFSGTTWGPLQGKARLDFTDDAPALLTAAEATVQDEKFARFRVLANTRGNPDSGKQLFTTLCLACHQFAGKGGAIAPALDGVGNTGVEALLRNLLTPSAAMESAYRTFRVVLTDGSVRDGFLVEESADSLLLRTPGAEDRRIPRNEIRSTSYLRRSLMPEGLIENLPPEHVSDLFAHLKSLR